MKRCPTCNKTFDDDALSFCLNDGASLVSETSSAPTPGLQATMMATPPSLGGASYPPPPPQSGPGSGSFNPPPPNPSWAPPPPNPSWATPSTQQASTPPKRGGINKKLIFGGLGCVGLVAIVGIVGIVFLFAFSGPRSKMNPYKGDLKDLVPEKVGIYDRVDVDVLRENDKEGFGAVNDAIGVAYKDGTDTKIEMFVGSYATPKDAEAGLESFKNKQISRDFTVADSGSKKEGRRTVGTRYILHRDTKVGKAIDDSLPDGARMVLVQSAAPPSKAKVRMVGWTNGTVGIVMVGPDDKAIYFEQTYDAAMKELID